MVVVVSNHLMWLAAKIRQERMLRYGMVRLCHCHYYVGAPDPTSRSEFESPCLKVSSWPTRDFDLQTFLANDFTSRYYSLWPLPIEGSQAGSHFQLANPSCQLFLSSFQQGSVPTAASELKEGVKPKPMILTYSLHPPCNNMQFANFQGRNAASRLGFCPMKHCKV